jgi:hypothetical protein
MMSLNVLLYIKEKNELEQAELKSNARKRSS